MLKKSDFMSEQTISALVQGGKATAGPPIGPALGPLGINAGKVVEEINEKTKGFAGIEVPVKIIVDTSAKTYEIEIGSPSVSALIKKELGIPKGSSKAAEEKAGNITIDQIIKIAMSKKDTLLARTDKAAVKEVVGSCIPMGILVNEKDPREIMKEIDEGKFDNKIEGKEELKMPTAEELNEMRKKYKLSEVKPELPVKKKAEETAEEQPAENNKKKKK